MFPAPGMAVPVRMRFAPDSHSLLYLFGEEGSEALSLWEYAVENGTRRVVAGPDLSHEAAAPPDGSASTPHVGQGTRDGDEFTLEEELRRERSRNRWKGITAFQFATRAPQPTLLVPHDDRLFVRVADGPWRALPDSHGAEDPQLFADGSRVAFVRDRELHVLDVAAAGGSAHPITQGADESTTHGLAEFVAQEEFGRAHGFWVRDDGRLIAFEEVDGSPVPPYTIVHQGDDHRPPHMEQHRYPFAGEANERVRLGVVASGGGEPLWLDLSLKADGGPAAGAEAPYVARVAWTPAGKLAVLLLSRDQRHMEWRLYDAQTGAFNVVLAEDAPHWLNVSNDTRFLASGEVLFSSERSGFRHLYLRSADGVAERPLTEGEWPVTGVVDVDEERRVVRFTGKRETPLEQQVYEVGLDGGKMRALTSEAGWHTAVWSPDHRWFAEQVSSLEHAPQTHLRAADGERLATIHADPQATALALGLVPPRIVRVTAADGETALYGAVYGDAGSPSPPLVLAPYGGPGAQMVLNAWHLTVDLRNQRLAQRGYVVLKLDNRGMAGRGAAFEAALRHRFGTIELEDQLAGVRWAQEHLGIDPERVGVYGWSYGGFFTLTALLKAPDVFRVGVAGAPVTDFAGYDTAYTERYMGTPAANPKGYAEQSLLGRADALRGDLLLIHGLLDENVHFRHTARMLDAFNEAGRDVDLLVLPKSRHAPRGQATRLLIARRTEEFFRAHL